MMQEILRRRTPPFAALQAFEAAGRLLSFKAAADELFVTPSAVSHRIRGLEELLEVQLFMRTPRAVGLTPVGRRYLLQIQDIFQRIETASRCLKMDGKGEELSIHATPSFTALWLMPKLTEFISNHPDVQFKVDASPKPANFASDKVDIDISYGQVQGHEIYSELLIRDRFTAFCSPAYFEKLGRPTVVATLENASLIQNVFNRIQWSDWLAANGVSPYQPDFALQTPRAMLGIQAAVDGLGVVLESHVMCSLYVQKGLLIKMFPDSVNVESADYFVACPKGNREIPIIRQFLDWLVQELNANNTAICTQG